MRWRLSPPSLNFVPVDGCNNSRSIRLRVLKYDQRSMRGSGNQKEQQEFSSLISSLWGFLSCLGMNKRSENLSKAGSRRKKGKTKYLSLCIRACQSREPKIKHAREIFFNPPIQWIWWVRGQLSLISDHVSDSHDMVMVPVSDKPIMKGRCSLLHDKKQK